MAGALDGCKVLDFTRVVSGPWCTLLLSDLGAEVIKVEEPGTGDFSRGFGPPFIAGESTYFMGYNRGKLSVTINLKHPRGTELFQGLVSKVDVLVHNYRRDWVYRAGMDYDTLIAINPRLIYCWISAYGEDGPFADKGSEDLAVMGISGAMSVTGQPDGPPIKSHVSFSDFLAGYNATVGILAALRVRDQTGEGQPVSVNLLDSATAVLGSLAYAYLATGEAPRRMAPESHPALALSGTFRTSDGYINIGASRQNAFRGLCAALDMEYLADDPDFSTNAARVKNRKRLRGMIEAVLGDKTNKECLDILNGKGVLAEPVNTIDQAFAHPQVVNNRMVEKLHHPSTGDVDVLRTAIRLPKAPLKVQGPPALLGEHTRDVLGRYLGIDDGEYARLHQDGVV